MEALKKLIRRRILGLSEDKLISRLSAGLGMG